MRPYLTLLFLLLLVPFGFAGGDEKDGWKLFQKRDYAAALKRFEMDANQYREWAELQDAMGWCHFFLEEYTGAEECFRKALKYKPDYKWSLMGLEELEAGRRAPLERADALYAAGKYPEARAAYQRIHEGETLAEPGAKAAALRGEGWCLYSLGEYREAIKVFREARKKNDRDPDIVRGLGYCEYAQQEYRRAITALQLALELDATHYLARLTLAWSHYSLESYDQALVEFQIAKDTVAGAWGAWSGIGWSKFKLGDEAGALAAFERGLELSPYIMQTGVGGLIEARPSWRRLHLVAGWSSLRAGLPTWAQGDFETAEALGCNVPEALAGEAFTHFRLEHYAVAASKAQAALDAGEGNLPHLFPTTLADGTTAEVTMNLSSLQGWIAYRQGKYDEALEAFRAVRREHRDWPDPACGEGWVLYAQGSYAAAENAFGEVLALLPGYPDATSGAAAIAAWRYADYEKGWAALLAGELSSARHIFRGIESDAQGPFPRTELSRIEASLGWAAFREGKHEAAERFFDAALALTPGLGLAEQGWGYLSIELERWREAARHLATATEDPALANDAEVWTALGRAQLELGALPRAGEAYAKAIELSPNLAVAHAGQGMLSLALGEQVEARFALERAFALEPTLSREEAIAAEVERVQELHKLHAPLGWAWLNRGEHALAEREFRLARERDPLEATAERGLGLTLLRRGEIKEARRLLDPWLKKAPSSENPWSTVSSTLSELGWILYGAKRYRDALVVFRDLEKLHRGQRELYADPFDGQGWCYLQTDKKKEARKAFEAALAITPGYASSQTGLDTLDEEQ